MNFNKKFWKIYTFFQNFLIKVDLAKKSKKAKMQKKQECKKSRKCTFDFKINAKKGRKYIFNFEIYTKKKSKTEKRNLFGFFRFYNIKVLYPLCIFSILHLKIHIKKDKNAKKSKKKNFKLQKYICKKAENNISKKMQNKLFIVLLIFVLII